MIYQCNCICDQRNNNLLWLIFWIVYKLPDNELIREYGAELGEKSN